LQIRHRGILSTQLHTVEWLKSLQSGQEFSGDLPVQAEPAEGRSPPEPRLPKPAGPPQQSSPEALRSRGYPNRRGPHNSPAQRLYGWQS
jgi:hypothetical protein